MHQLPDQNDPTVPMQPIRTSPALQPPAAPDSSSRQIPPYRGRTLAIWILVYALTWWFFTVGAYSQNHLVGDLAGFALIGEGIALFLIRRQYAPAKRTTPAMPQGMSAINQTSSSTNRNLLIGCLVFLFLPVLLMVGIVYFMFFPAGSLGKGLWTYYRLTRQHPGHQVKAGWQLLSSASRRAQLGIIAGVLLSLCALITSTGLVMGSPNPGFLDLGATPTATQVAQASTDTSPDTTTISIDPSQLPTATSTPEPTATATVAPTPTATEEPLPTTTPVPQPVYVPPPPPPPTAPSCSGVNGNPWCYDFNPGNLIYSPPGAFCTYFSCINNFWNGRGYVMECNDGMYSKSGGIQGSCSYHGGNQRPLYSH